MVTPGYTLFTTQVTYGYTQSHVGRIHTGVTSKWSCWYLPATITRYKQSSRNIDLCTQDQGLQNIRPLIPIALILDKYIYYYLFDDDITKIKHSSKYNEAQVFSTKVATLCQE